MGRLGRQKRLLMEEANKVLLGEQVIDKTDELRDSLYTKFMNDVGYDELVANDEINEKIKALYLNNPKLFTMTGWMEEHHLDNQEHYMVWLEKKGLKREDVHFQDNEYERVKMVADKM